MKRTQLKRRVPLERKSELKPGEPPARKTRINPVSAKQRKKMDAWAKVRQQLMDDGRVLCEACEVHYLPACSGQFEHAHHVQLRSQGGPDTLANALPVGHRHHSWIHRNPIAAKQLGLIRTEQATT